MELPVDIQNKSGKLFQLCSKYKVVRLFVFGSAANGTFETNKSDLDLFVEMDIDNPIERGESLMSFWNELEQLFSRKVDLLTGKNIRNPYLRAQIDATKRLLYDRAGK